MIPGQLAMAVFTAQINLVNGPASIVYKEEAFSGTREANLPSH